MMGLIINSIYPDVTRLEVPFCTVVHGDHIWPRIFSLGEQYSESVQNKRGTVDTIPCSGQVHDFIIPIGEEHERISLSEWYCVDFHKSLPMELTAESGISTINWIKQCSQAGHQRYSRSKN